MDEVKIVWWDTQDYSDGKWASNDEVNEFSKKPCDITSYGLLIRKTRHYVTICGDFSPDPDTYGRVMKIPRKMIKSITKLVEPTPIQKNERPVGD